MSPIITLVVLAVMFTIAFFHGFIQTPPDPIATLKERYVVLSRRARNEALLDLEERVEALTRRFPGKTYLWYLEWLVTDLERAKR